MPCGGPGLTLAGRTVLSGSRTIVGACHRGVAALAVMLFLVLPACGSETSIPASAQRAGWKEDVERSTCAEWLDAMTEEQRLGGINDLLPYLVDREPTAKQIRGVTRAVDRNCKATRSDLVGDALGQFMGSCAYSSDRPAECF